MTYDLPFINVLVFASCSSKNVTAGMMLKDRIYLKGDEFTLVVWREREIVVVQSIV